MTPKRDRRGRFTKRKTRANPFVEDALVKPFLGAIVGHVGGRMAKAGTDRVVKRRKRKGKR